MSLPSLPSLPSLVRTSLFSFPALFLPRWRTFMGQADRPRVRTAPRAIFTITPRAAKHLKEMIEQRDPPPLGVRVGIQARGCNGLSYTMDYAEERRSFEEVVEAEGVKLFIDPKAQMYLVGATMDWEEDDVKAEFRFHNPNETSRCGCGESFSV